MFVMCEVFNIMKSNSFLCQNKSHNILLIPVEIGFCDVFFFFKARCSAECLTWLQYSWCGLTVLTCPHHVADGGQLTEGGVVGQDVLDGHLVGGAADVSLLTEVAETRHGHQHRLCVRTPQEHVERHLQLGLRLPADRDPSAHRGTLLEQSTTKSTFHTKICHNARGFRMTNLLEK